MVLRLLERIARLLPTFFYSECGKYTSLLLLIIENQNIFLNDVGKSVVVRSPDIDFRKFKELSILIFFNYLLFAAGNRLNSGGGHHGPVITESFQCLIIDLFDTTRRFSTFYLFPKKMHSAMFHKLLKN